MSLNEQSIELDLVPHTFSFTNQQWQMLLLLMRYGAREIMFQHLRDQVHTMDCIGQVVEMYNKVSAVVTPTPESSEPTSQATSQGASA